MPSVELTQPAVEPVSLDEMKAHCRISLTDEDSYLRTFNIPAARRHAEAFAHRAFVTRTFRQDVAGGDIFNGTVFTPVAIDFSPLVSVQSVYYYVPGASSTTLLATTVYAVDVSDDPGQLWLLPNQAWPSIDQQRFNSVQISYTAGYGSTAESVPENYRMAILLICAHLLEHRGDEEKHFVMPQSARDLLTPSRVFKFV